MKVVLKKQSYFHEIFMKDFFPKYSRENACGQKYECSFKNSSTHGVFNVSQPIFWLLFAISYLVIKLQIGQFLGGFRTTFCALLWQTLPLIFGKKNKINKDSETSTRWGYLYTLQLRFSELEMILRSNIDGSSNIYGS